MWLCLATVLPIKTEKSSNQLVPKLNRFKEMYSSNVNYNVIRKKKKFFPILLIPINKYFVLHYKEKHSADIYIYVFYTTNFEGKGILTSSVLRITGNRFSSERDI